MLGRRAWEARMLLRPAQQPEAEIDAPAAQLVVDFPPIFLLQLQEF